MKIGNDRHRSFIWTILYTIVIFLVVYNPPVSQSYSFTILAVIISLGYILINFRTLSRAFSQKVIKYTFSFFLIFYIYYSVEAVILGLGSNDNLVIETYKTTTVSFVSFFAVSFAIAIYALKRRMSFEYLCKLYVYAAIFQSVIALICLALPPVKEALNAYSYINSDSDLVKNGLEFSFDRRNYGFASTLNDIFGFAMSLIGIISISFAIGGKKIYYLFGFIFAIVAGINGRSGFFIFIIGFVVCMLSSRNNKISASSLSRVVFLFLFLGGVAILFSWIQDNANTEQLAWLASAVDDTKSLSQGKTTGYFDTLFNDFLFFPDGISLIFGTGLTPYDVIKKNSDVGYVQNIWSYGIIGSFLLYMFYYNLLKAAYKRLEWPNSTMLKSFLIMIFIYQVKLTCFGYSMASVIFGPLCFYVLCSKNFNNKI